MSLRDDIVRVAREQIGKPYDTRDSYPWEGPASDYDSFNCSGLTRAVFDECGVTIPGFQRASLGDSQSRWVMDAGNWRWTPADGLQPGDLVFWQDGETWEDTYHVGIYTGDETCVSANGPRMGVAEHYIYIDQGFIGGGWPIDWAEGRHDDSQDETKDEGLIMAADAWGIVGDEHATYVDMGTKIVLLDNEYEQRFVEWYIGRCKEARDRGEVPHVSILHDSDGEFQRGDHMELLLQIVARSSYVPS